jgi:hypothetical protein
LLVARRCFPNEEHERQTAKNETSKFHTSLTSNLNFLSVQEAAIITVCHGETADYYHILHDLICKVVPFDSFLHPSHSSLKPLEYCFPVYPFYITSLVKKPIYCNEKSIHKTLIRISSVSTGEQEPVEMHKMNLASSGTTERDDLGAPRYTCRRLVLQWTMRRQDAVSCISIA